MEAKAKAQVRGMGGGCRERGLGPKGCSGGEPDCWTQDASEVETPRFVHRCLEEVVRAKEASSPGLGLSDLRMEESVSKIRRLGQPLRLRLNLRCLNRDVQQVGGNLECGERATREPQGSHGGSLGRGKGSSPPRGHMRLQSGPDPECRALGSQGVCEGGRRKALTSSPGLGHAETVRR